MAAAGQHLRAAASAQEAFYEAAMYALDVQGWPSDRVYPRQPLSDPVTAPEGARLRLWQIAPEDGRRLPPLADRPPVLETAQFSLVNSGNRTLMAPKRSWKVDLDPGQVAGMSTLNLKSMYNDPSQMREALAWGLFRTAGVPASRHTYARLGINDRYLGLFALIEQVDKAFLRECFAGKPRGNLFKVYCGELGPGTLQRRVGADGDDSGRQYRSKNADDATYRLKSYSDAPNANSYDDLAQLCRAIDGTGLPGGDDRYDTDAFAAGVREVFDVEMFLRWAGVNILVGAWDNYFARLPTTTSTTPAAEITRMSSARRISGSSRGTTTTRSASTISVPRGSTRTCSTGHRTPATTGAVTATGVDRSCLSSPTCCGTPDFGGTTWITSSISLTPRSTDQPSTP